MNLFATEIRIRVIRINKQMNIGINKQKEKKQGWALTCIKNYFLCCTENVYTVFGFLQFASFSFEQNEIEHINILNSLLVYITASTPLNP